MDFAAIQAVSMLNRVFGAFSGFSTGADKFRYASWIATPFENNADNAETIQNISTRKYELYYRFQQRVSHDMSATAHASSVPKSHQQQIVTWRNIGVTSSRDSNCGEGRRDLKFVLFSGDVTGDEGAAVQRADVVQSGDAV